MKRLLTILPNLSLLLAFLIMSPVVVSGQSIVAVEETLDYLESESLFENIESDHFDDERLKFDFSLFSNSVTVELNQYLVLQDFVRSKIRFSSVILPIRGSPLTHQYFM